MLQISVWKCFAKIDSSIAPPHEVGLRMVEMYSAEGRLTERSSEGLPVSGSRAN